MKRNILILILIIAVCLAVGLIGSLFTSGSLKAWYPMLTKPWFTPPDWLFGPVWTALYIMMGAAAFLIWRKGWNTQGVRVALIAFGIQLLLNALWSPAFFGLRSTLAGLIVIVLLLAAITLTTLLFFTISRPAGALMIPYLAWVSFATSLNSSLHWLNR
jgi:tryptophan-rich sensory protein